MPYTNASGVNIYYESHGTGPAILFVHGSGGHHTAWWRQTAYLSRWFTVLTIDLRGFGNSDPVEGGPDARDFTADIAAVLDHSGVGPCAILGQSIGASPALRIAVEQPERVSGVLLAHSLGGISDPELKQLAAANRAEAEKLPVIDRLLTKEFQSGRPAETFLFRQMGTFNHATMQDLRNLSAEGPSLEQVQAIAPKLHFIAGERDAVLWNSTVRRAHEKLPGSHLTIVPNGPHSMYWEMPDVFNHVVHRALLTIYPEVAA